MTSLLSGPWPWYVAGPLIGLMVPLLLWVGNKQFGISSTLRHFCSAALPLKASYFQYDWKKEKWSLLFVLGITIGAFIAGQFSTDTFTPGQTFPGISEKTVAQLKAIGVKDFNNILPKEFFSWEGLQTTGGFILIVVGGFLVGFGTRYAGGCTSGHAIMGLSLFSPSSLVAVIGFFIGGLLATHFLLPIILSL